MFRWLLPLLATLALSAQDLTLQVLHSSDTHGHLLPEDTYTLQPAAKGWARLAPLVRELRARHSHTVHIDTGDTLQGEPVNYVACRLRPDLPEPMTALLRSLGCDALVPGNHDFDWGLDTLRATASQAGFPVLAANLVDGTGRPAFATHRILERGGARIAVLGLLSAHLAPHAIPGSLQGLTLADPVATARAWVPRLRAQEKADLVILALHGGPGTTSCHPGDENVGICLAEQVPGIDLILTGHTHQGLAQRHAGVPLLQPEPWAASLGVAEFVLRKVKGRWTPVSCEMRLAHPDPALPPDAQVLALTEPHRAATTTYLDTFATQLQVDLDGRWTRMEDTAMMRLLHDVQHQAAAAQVSAAASPGTRLFIPKGPTSVRQFWALHPYEHRLARIRVSGTQLRAYLEHAARFYAFSHQPVLFNREVPAHDYDTLSGVTYALDISRPPGSRVVDLRFAGQPVQEAQSFTLALSTYRLANGGGYLEAMQWRGEPEWVSEASLRNLLLASVLTRPTLDLPLGQAWRIIPALDRERVMAQQP